MHMLRTADVTKAFRMFTYMTPGYADCSWQGHATNGEVFWGSVEVYEMVAIFCVFAWTSEKRKELFVVVATVMRRTKESPRLY